MSVLLPTPEGPHITTGSFKIVGAAGAATAPAPLEGETAVAAVKHDLRPDREGRGKRRAGR